MSYILIGIGFYILGVFSFPFILFLRARRDKNWDNSNMTNMLRVLSHLATHPGDFADMHYINGGRPFWYIDKDEFSEVVDTRPEDDTQSK